MYTLHFTYLGYNSIGFVNEKYEFNNKRLGQCRYSWAMTGIFSK
jgi:hypothetical protein